MDPTPWFESAGDRATRYWRAIQRYRALPVFDERPVAAPPASVTVVIPTLDEEDYVVDACRSLALQTLRRDHPDSVEIALVDSASRDATRTVARPFVDRIVKAPRGKLVALTTGVHKARGEIIVEADADGWFPPGWVERMVRPFEDPRVVAIRGRFVYYDSPVLRVSSAPLRGILSAMGNFPGGVRAYRRDAFRDTGGFDTTVNQQNFWSVWPEEEFKFKRRLARVGGVRDARDAVCFKSARRGDPFFVRDARADRFRRNLRASGRFRDGVTDGLYRARKLLAGTFVYR